MFEHIFNFFKLLFTGRAASVREDFEALNDIAMKIIKELREGQEYLRKEIEEVKAKEKTCQEERKEYEKESSAIIKELKDRLDKLEKNNQL